ncbi:unnamed protein product [Lymnaea stagnalis]|uniref:Uncharacterized protein n=1 Tax=Lymnaea stagnalis TaxID=6523 RepID=A0AAV2IMW4_LYMST
MEQKDKLGVKESIVSLTATRQMVNMPMPLARFEHPPPPIQISFIPYGCPPLFSPKQATQLNIMMPVPYIPPLRPPSLLGNPPNVQSISENTIISREIYYGSVTSNDVCLKDGEASTQICQKSLTKASEASKSAEVSVTEKFCSIAKEHGLTVELVNDEEFPALSRKESQRCPLNSTQPNIKTFDSFCPKALDQKKHLNPLVDAYIPHAFQHPLSEANVDLVPKWHPAAEENSVNNSAKGVPVTEENLSITESQSRKDVLTEPVCVQQTKPPLRPLLLPNMPKAKKSKTGKDATVQTDDEEKPDSRLCPICQGKPSDSDKCSVTPVFKNISLEQKTKYLALQASFLMRESTEVTKSQDDQKKILKKKLQILYKQFGTKDKDISDWEDELMCQVVISLLNDSPALASPDQNSMLLARLREEVNILNEITASLMESPITSKPPLNVEIKNMLVPTDINAEETLPDNPHSATKSALMSSQGSSLMAEGMHLSNSSSGVSLSSADLSTGPAITAVVSSTALTDDTVGIVSVSNKNHTANPIQIDKTPKLAVPDAVEDKTFGPLVNKVICPNQTYCPSLQQFFDSMTSSHPSKTCNTEQKTYPTSASSTNSTPDHLQLKGKSAKRIVISVEQKGNESSLNPETIKTTVDSHKLDNTLENRELKTYAKLLSTIGHSETRNQGLKPLVIRPLDKMYKAPGYSQDSIDSPFKDALKSSAFENIKKADKLRSRTQSETSDLSDKDALTTVTVWKPDAVQVTSKRMHCEVDNQAEDLRESPGRLRKLKTPERATETWLEAKPISLQTKISSDKSSRTFSTLPSSSSSISHLSVFNTLNPLMESHNLMLNPPLSVTAFSGSISSVSNSGSSSAAVFPTPVSNKNSLRQQLLTNSSFPDVGHCKSVLSTGRAEASERNPTTLTAGFNFDEFVKEQKMLHNPAVRPLLPYRSNASSCAAPLDVLPQSITQSKVLNFQQADRGYDQASLREILELQTMQETEELNNLKKKYVHLMMNLQSHSMSNTSNVNFPDPNHTSSLAHTVGASNFPGTAVHLISKESMSEVNNKYTNKNFEESDETKRKVGVNRFSPSRSPASDWSEESSLKKPCNKTPLDVRVRKVSSKGLQSVKDWVSGNVQTLETTPKSDPCSRSTVKSRVESQSDHNRTKANLSLNITTADNQCCAAGEENSFASNKFLIPFDRKRMSAISPEEQKTAHFFDVENFTEFNKATPLPENTNLYTRQSLLNKYCYSSVAARLIALASRGNYTFPSWSGASNKTPEHHSYATIIKSSPLKTPTVVSSEPTCRTEDPVSKWSWKEGDISSWKGKPGSHSSLNNNEDFQTEKSSIANANFGDHNEEKQSDRIWGNMFKLDQDTQAPQIGDCKLDLTLCNLNNHVGDHSAMKSSNRQDWFDIDNISLSESFSSLTRDYVYTEGDVLSRSSVLNDSRTSKKSMDGSDEIYHDYVTRKSKHSQLEDISLWEENGKGEINGKTDQVKPDTKKSSGDDNVVWMKVTNAKKQKVSLSDRLEEFRQQEKYKNLTTRILEIKFKLLNHRRSS